MVKNSSSIKSGIFAATTISVWTTTTATICAAIFAATTIDASPKTSKRYEDIPKSKSEIDPYALYGLQKGQPFTESYLKEKYKDMP